MGFSDPVFMRARGEEPWPAGKHCEYPYDPEACERAIASGDAEMKKRKELGYAWLGEVNTGLYRTWEDIAFLREHWKGPIVLKGIQSVKVRR